MKLLRMRVSIKQFILFYMFIIFLGNQSYPCESTENFNSSNNSFSKLLTKRPCKSKFVYSDYNMTTPEVIAKYGLPVETHVVQTEDGYILQMFRIPAPGKPVVFLSHGIAATSRYFLINCDRRALGVKLADAGYDVWLANYRGNVYSQNHTKLTALDKTFWDYTIEDVAMYDTSAMIDYILENTAQEKFSWVGHSMGTFYTTGLFLLRPEYLEKVNIGFCLAGSIRLANTQHRALQIFQNFDKQSEKVLYRLTQLIMKATPKAKAMVNEFCRFTHAAKLHLCSWSFFAIDGYDAKQLVPELLEVFLGDFPQINSPRIFSQWMQWIRTGKVSRYDHGAAKNKELYGSVFAPEFDYTKMTSPMVMFYGDNDLLIPPEGVRASAAILPNATLERVQWLEWTHMDFVIAQDADLLVYDKIIDYLKNHQS